MTNKHTEIPLGSEDVFYYDEESGLLRWKVDNNCMKAGDKAGNIGPRGYGQVSWKGRKLSIHRLIHYIHTGEWPDYVDHIDGNTWNNDPSNLRAATINQNMWNRKTHANNKAGFRGVKFHAGGNGWHARIQANGVNRTLGFYRTLIDAVAARLMAERELHGEYARKPSAELDNLEKQQ